MAWENLPSTSTPINATNLNKITDSGSNANGNYIKYQDGTMICWTRIEGATHQNEANISGRYYFTDNNNSSENVKSWTFPAAFITYPTVTLSVNSSAYTMTSLGYVNGTATSGYCVTPYAVDSVKFIWNFFAIGKWK